MTSQEAIALAAVRALRLLAELHESLTMTPGDLRRLLARYQRALTELAEATRWGRAEEIIGSALGGMTGPPAVPLAPGSPAPG